MTRYEEGEAVTTTMAELRQSFLSGGGQLTPRKSETLLLTPYRKAAPDVSQGQQSNGKDARSRTGTSLLNRVRLLPWLESQTLWKKER